jgi:hypothetical protein
MEDKRGIKQEFSPSEEGSPTPSDAKTPSPMSAGSPPPPGSPSEVSSDHPHSPVFEQGRPSRIALVIKIPSSSNEEDFFADVTWDAKFAKRLFGDFHHDLLRLPGDGKVIIIRDPMKKRMRVRRPPLKPRPRLLLLMGRLQLQLPPLLMLMKTPVQCHM